jgi:hypothetical protein
MAKNYENSRARKNFTEVDRELLISLVIPSIEILKDLRKDTVTNRKKVAV